MREVLLIVIVIEGVREGEGIVEALEAEIITFIAVHEIVNVLANSVPTYTVLLLYLLREGEYLHSVIV